MVRPRPVFAACPESVTVPDGGLRPSPSFAALPVSEIEPEVRVILMPLAAGV
jgi:hypothetical protein